MITPGYLVLFVGGKKVLLPLPFPIFDLVHVQFICFFRYRWTAVYPNSFYPVTVLPITVVTWTAHYPVDFGLPGNLFNIGQSEIYSLLVSGKSMELILNVYVQAGENDRNPTGRAGTDPAP